MKAPLLLSVFLLTGTSLAFANPPGSGGSEVPNIQMSDSSQSVPGDINGDGVVNCLDFNLVYASFGIPKGQSGYNPAADLNNDGVVNIQDLSTVARNVPKGTVCQKNVYQIAGEQFLDKLNATFYNSTKGLGLYAETINSSTNQQGANAFLWSTDYLLQALYRGARVDSKYQPNLASLISATSWYKNGPGYGTLHNAERFFDDNSQLGSVLMKIYLNELPQQSVLDESLFALNYVQSNRDAQGGVPQTEKDLGKGIFYMGPSVTPSIALAEYYLQSPDPNYLSSAEGYFQEVNDPALGLIGPKTGLFIGGTVYSNGTWNPNNVGPLASNSTQIINLALALYRATGNTTYLTYAQQLLPVVLKRYYTPGAGVKEVSVWGGSGIVDVLCQLYQIDGNIVWYNDAKDIVDFLLNNSRDTAGWFPDGTTSAGDWNIVRTGNPPDATVTVLTQAAAASAILEFAYIDIHK